MKLRRVYGVCAAIVLLFGLASPASALPIFNYNGAGNEGGIVWDGDADVGTMNSNCFAPLCLSEALGTISPNNIQALVTLQSPVTFSSFNLALLLSVPIANLPGACGAIVCQSFTDYFADANKNTPFHFPNQTTFTDNPSGPTAADVGIIILPFDPVSGLPAQLSGVLTINLSNASKTFLNGLNPSLLSAAMAGFALEFGEVVAGTPEDPFVNFSVSLQPTAVPEPTSMLLLGSGLAGMVARRYRRRTTAQS